MQQSITPCQRNISDRFPVASFVVNVPPSRLFEIVCATDPGLLQAENRHARAAHNFFTSRSGGLLRAPAGHATYLLPPDQLRRFAGKQRLYFALASYGNARGEDLAVSVPPNRLAEVPCIRLSADFTGRTLDRSRIRRGGRDVKYGAPNPVLTWGGDEFTTRQHAPAATALAYDDGYSPELWKGRGTDSSPVAPPVVANPQRAPAVSEHALAVRAARTPTPVASEARQQTAAHSEPAYEPCEEMGLGEAYGRPTRSPDEPSGYEDGPTLRAARAQQPSPAASHSYGRALSSSNVGAFNEPAGYEDARSLRMRPAPVAKATLDGGQTVRFGSSYGGSAEPPGYEDGRAVRIGSANRASMPRNTYGGGRSAAALALDEPAGAEDGRAVLDGAPVASSSTPMAPVEARDPATPPATAAAPPAGETTTVGVDDAWQEEDTEADLPSVPGEGDGDALTIRRKFEILLPVAEAISGAERYSSVLSSVEYDDPTHSGYQRVHHGLHWGIVHFTQRSGALGRVLRACERRDAMQFKQAFGSAMVEKLLQVTGAEAPEARLLPVAGALLWTEPWLRTFREAGKIQAFQAAQNEVAIEQYFDRNLGFAMALGLDTDRALAMLFDRSVHMGLGGGRAFVLSAISTLEDGATRSAALAALGHADLASFQSASGLTATGRFGAQTHAALYGALRALGARSPVLLPTLVQALDRLVTAATGRRFEGRLRALRTSTAFSDTVERAL